MPPDKHDDADFIITADNDQAGTRLDILISEEFGCSRNRAASLIKQGIITVNQHPAKPARKISAGDLITGALPPEPDMPLPAPEAIPLDIIFEDAALIVINKPAGLVVHPAPGHIGGTLVNALLQYAPHIKNIGDKSRPGIVHRLDQNTSGALVAAKTKVAHQKLSALFAEKQVDKRYLAITYGTCKKNSGTITTPIGRHPVHRKKMAVNGSNPRKAETRWKVLKTFSDAALVRADIKTGRTHQIRVHCADAGHPVVGDPVYAGRWTTRPAHFSNKEMYQRLQKAPRQMLHAWKLGFAHPESGEPVRFIAPPPADIKELLKDLIRMEEG